MCSYICRYIWVCVHSGQILTFVLLNYSSPFFFYIYSFISVYDTLGELVLYFHRNSGHQAWQHKSYHQLFFETRSLTASGEPWLARLVGQQTLEMVLPPPQDLGYTCLFGFYNGLGYLNADPHDYTESVLPIEQSHLLGPTVLYFEVPLVWCLQFYSFSQ